MASRRTCGSRRSRPPTLPRVAVAVVVLNGGRLGSSEATGGADRRADRTGGAPGGARMTRRLCSASRDVTEGSGSRTAGDARGSVPRRARARPRWDGQGLSRRGHGPRPHRRDEDPRTAVRRRPELRRALPSRGPGGGATLEPARRLGLRHRLRGRTSISSSWSSSTAAPSPTTSPAADGSCPTARSTSGSTSAERSRPRTRKAWSIATSSPATSW